MAGLKWGVCVIKRQGVKLWLNVVLEKSLYIEIMQTIHYVFHRNTVIRKTIFISTAGYPCSNKKP